MAQTHEAAIVDSAATALEEIMAIPMRQIPESLLADAQGIAILPDLLKGGFVVGVRHGRGVVLVRQDDGSWKPPVFITLTGGSVGWQVGLQAMDLILVFKTRRSVQNLLRGKFTLGADAAAAAGPVGRQAAAATDAMLRAEILSYSRSRGLFAGVSLDGSVLQIDQQANAAYYGGFAASPLNPFPGQQTPVPASAARLLELVGRYTKPLPNDTVRSAPVSAQPQPTPADPQSLDATKQQLGQSAKRLYGIVDATWRTYLALPPEVYASDRHPDVAMVSRSLAQFDCVAAAPQYRALTDRPEFQATHDLLRRYVNLLTAQAAQASPALALPPPPNRPGL